MCIDMDEDDKNFFIVWFNDLKKEIKDDIKEVRNHQKKTCDELDEVDKKVTAHGKDLKNHIDSVQKEESNKRLSQKSSREKKALIISTISVSVAVISVSMAIFMNI